MDVNDLQGGKLFPLLKAPDLLVRLSRPGDEDILATYFQNNRTFHKPFDPIRSDVFFTKAGWRQRLLQLHHLHKRELAYYFLIFYKGEKQLSGVISYSNLIRYPFHACTLGYSLDEKHQGEGIMQNSLKLTNEWMFVEQNMHRIIANYMPHNEKSAKVLAALDFEIEGCAKNYLLIDGQWQDHVLTSLTNELWREQTR